MENVDVPGCLRKSLMISGEMMVVTNVKKKRWWESNGTGMIESYDVNSNLPLRPAAEITCILVKVSTLLIETDTWRSTRTEKGNQFC